jgi:hypothetical protein
MASALPLKYRTSARAPLTALGQHYRVAGVRGRGRDVPSWTHRRHPGGGKKQAVVRSNDAVCPDAGHYHRCVRSYLAL